MRSHVAPVISIAKHTLLDEVRQKSFIVMFVICALFIFMVRGCYQGGYTINGQDVEAGKIIFLVSGMIFHVIATGVMFLAGLLAMRLFRRDRDDGTQSCILSKPITRRQYVAGKVLGLWILLMVFMFVLHGIVFSITSFKLNTILYSYLVASMLCFFNLLFIVMTVLFLSLLMPDIAALLCTIVIVIAGSVAEGILAMKHSLMSMGQGVASDSSVWQVIFYLWPKLIGAQRFAVSLITPEGSGYHASVYPLINILVYCIIVGALLFWRFQKEDIT